MDVIRDTGGEPSVSNQWQMVSVLGLRMLSPDVILKTNLSHVLHLERGKAE